jgi:NADH:ubiquinone oxidoreductase subunit F (NADH-binding)
MSCEPVQRGEGGTTALVGADKRLLFSVNPLVDLKRIIRPSTIWIFNNKLNLVCTVCKYVIKYLKETCLQSIGCQEGFPAATHIADEGQLALVGLLMDPEVPCV